MMKFFVLGCMFAAVAANLPLFVSPVGVTVQSSFGYAVPLQYPYNSAHLAIKNLDNGFHSLKKRSVTRLAVAPGSLGFSAALATGNAGFAVPINNIPTGLAATIATNPTGVSSPFTVTPFGISSPIVAGSAGISTPFGGVSTTINANPISFPSPIAVSAPLSTGSVATNTSPVAVGSIAASASTAPITF